MKLTRQMIDDGKSHRGGWNADQLAVLGIAWPPLKGWPDRVVGTEIAEEMYEKFLALRKKAKEPELFHRNEADQAAEIDRLKAELAEKQKRIELHCRDWAEDDTAIKAVLAKFGIREDDHPGYFKSSIECVDELAAKLEKAIEHVRAIWQRSQVLGTDPHEENYSDAILASQFLGVKFPSTEEMLAILDAAEATKPSDTLIR